MRRREGKERGGEMEVMKTQPCREEQGKGGGTGGGAQEQTKDDRWGPLGSGGGRREGGVRKGEMNGRVGEERRRREPGGKRRGEREVAVRMI